MKKPCFDELVKILNKQVTDKPVLFEFFLNENLYSDLSEGMFTPKNDGHDSHRIQMYAYLKAGYDYFCINPSSFCFPIKPHDTKKSTSYNEAALIFDWDSYEQYEWPEPEDYDCSRLDVIGGEIPEGFKLIAHGPCGIVENATQLLGYENMCYLMYDDYKLVKQVYDDIGSRLLKYYEIGLQYDSVGAIMCNDDWGFNTQTLISTDKLRELVFPWYKKIVKKTHSSGRPAILHSCGQLKEVYGDIIDDMKFDAKHSYEDSICPVEEMYEQFCGKIAVLGGIDLDFVVRGTPEAIKDRCRKMIERTLARGGYALGTGNSVPYYVPKENYLAMISTIDEYY